MGLVVVGVVYIVYISFRFLLVFKVQYCYTYSYTQFDSFVKLCMCVNNNNRLIFGSHF